jgi:hypothetical protein
MPATTLRDAVLSHPTMVEGSNALFALLTSFAHVRQVRCYAIVALVLFVFFNWP